MRKELLVALTVALPLKAMSQDGRPPQIIVCDESRGCPHQFIDGGEFKFIKDHNLVVAASADNGWLQPKFRSFTVMVKNDTDQDIDVIPAQFVLEEIEPKAKLYNAIAAEKVASTVDRGMHYEDVMKLALRANTVATHDSVVGSVFFEHSKSAKIIRLNVVVNGVIYQFPVSPDAESR